MTTVLRAVEANVVFALLMLWAVVYSHLTNQRQAEPPAYVLPEWDPWDSEQIRALDIPPPPVVGDDAALDRLLTAVLADPWAAPDRLNRINFEYWQMHWRESWSGK